MRWDSKPDVRSNQAHMTVIIKQKVPDAASVTSEVHPLADLVRVVSDTTNASTLLS